MKNCNLIILVGVLIFLGACHARPGEFDSYIIVGVESYPDNLDPRIASDALSSKINRLLYNGLFRLNAALEVVHDLAMRVDQKRDLVFEIQIRNDVFFHNGKKLSASDVVATYESLLDPDKNYPKRQSLEKMERIERVDDHTVRVILKEPFAPLFSALTFPILPEEVARGNFVPLGTGPYQFVKTKKNEAIVLRRHDSYFGEKPFNEGLVFKTIYDDTLRTLELIKGRLDFLQNVIPPLLIPAVLKAGLLFEKDKGVNFTYLGFNLKDPILKNKLVRQAIALAINREELIHYKLRGLAHPATSLLFPDHWVFNQDLKSIDYDPDRARKILDGAGFLDPDGDGPKTRFRLVYKTSSKKDRVDMALLIAESLKKVGIEVGVQANEWGTFFRDVRTGNFQIVALTWVGVTDPDIYYYAFHSSEVPPQGGNRGAYSNQVLDSLLEAGRRELDPEKRKNIYLEVQKIVFEDLPIVPLWYEDNGVSTQKNISGYQLRPDAGYEGLLQTKKGND